MYEAYIRDKYPEKVLDDRLYHETMVVASILRDLTLLDDYVLSDRDFLSVEYNILYRIAKKMKEENYGAALQLELKARLSDEEKEFFKTEDIWHCLSNSSEVMGDNFPDYVDKLYRSNIFLKLIDLGFDLMKETVIEGKNIVPFELFTSMTSNEVKEFYEYYINNFTTVDAHKGIDEVEVDFTDEYIEELYAGGSVGTLFDIAGEDISGTEIVAFPSLSDESNGFVEGTMSMLSGYSNVGKSTFLISLVMALVYRGEKVVLCSNEQSSKPFIDNFLIWVLYNKLGYREMTKKKMKKGKTAFSKKDIEMIEKARKLWKEEYSGTITFISLPTARMDFVLKKFREYHLRNGCTFFIYDTFKFDFYSGKDENFWLGLVKDSRQLADFAHKYKVKVFATMQNAIHTQGQLWLDANVLSQSKQVKEVLQNLYLMRGLYEEEKDESSQFYCEPYRRIEEMRGGVQTTKFEKLVLSPNKKYRTVFIDKTRDGITSEDGNYAVVLEFEGDYGAMKEIGFCKPKRLNINARQKKTAGK